MLVVMQLVVALVHVAVYFAGVGLGWWGDGPNARGTASLSALVVALFAVVMWLRRSDQTRPTGAARPLRLTLLITVTVYSALTTQSIIELVRYVGGASDRSPVVDVVILFAATFVTWSLSRQDAVSTGERVDRRE